MDHGHPLRRILMSSKSAQYACIIYIKMYINSGLWQVCRYKRRIQAIPLPHRHLSLRDVYDQEEPWMAWEQQRTTERR